MGHLASFILVGFWILTLLLFVSDLNKFWKIFGPKKNYIINSGIIVGLLLGSSVFLISFHKQDAIDFYIPKYIAGMIIGITVIFMAWAILNYIDGISEGFNKRKLDKMKEETRRRLLSEAEIKEKSQTTNNT